MTPHLTPKMRAEVHRALTRIWFCEYCDQHYRAEIDANLDQLTELCRQEVEAESVLLSYGLTRETAARLFQPAEECQGR